MNKKEFERLLENQAILLDGGYGTFLTELGMPHSVCPEEWAVKHPDVLEKVHKGYIKAGSRIIYTFTLGANQSKLSNFHLSHQDMELNRQLASIAKKTVEDAYLEEPSSVKALVAGDIGPTGKGIKPLGSLEFEEAVNLYKRQVIALLEEDVDLFVIETMIDIQEARAAAIAIKETCDLPFIATITFEKNGRTVGGTSPASAMITMQSLGASAVGANCGHGPDSMIEMIRAMKSVATVPVIAKPNAGIPRLVNGRTVFDMNAREFIRHCEGLLDEGVTVIGGCCGTKFQCIEGLNHLLKEVRPVGQKDPKGYLSSGTDAFVFDSHQTGMVIGERINPTGKKQLQKELSQGIYDSLVELARQQQDAGASVLDVNVSVPGCDESSLMTGAVEKLSWAVRVPLCLDSSDPDVFEKALRIYPGRALVNSVSLEKEKVEKVLPIVKKYGGMVILLPLNGTRLPKDNEEKHKIILQLVKTALEYGLSPRDLVVDALTMSVASVPGAGKDILDTIAFCKQNKWFTLSGLSNISFGMPERKTMNAAMITLCIQKGLNFAIADPTSDLVMNAVYATKLLMNEDPGGTTYIQKVRRQETITSVTVPVNQVKLQPKSKDSPIYNSVLKGRFDSIVKDVQNGLDEGLKPESVVEELLIPAIEEVGILYEKNIYYLPQLIASSNAMKKAVEYLEPLLKKQSKAVQKPVCVLATVKGDIHDIGKNIVSLVLANNGFETVDLGKDVEAKTIIDAAVNHNAKIIGLSALMTVTMRNMKEVIELKNQICPHVKVMIGGACVTAEYAKQIGADGYGENANEAVRVAKGLLGME